MRLDNAGIFLLDLLILCYANSPNDQEKNDKIKLKYFQ